MPLKAKTARKNIFLLTIPTIVVVIIASVLLWFFERMKSADSMRMETTLALNSSQKILSTLIDAEIGIRSYILTGSDVFLEPFETSRADVATELDNLRRLSSTPATIQKADELGPLADKQIAFLDSTVALQGRENITKQLSQFIRGSDAQAMTNLRQALENYDALQNDQLKYYRNLHRKNLNYLFGFIIVVSVVLLLFAQAFAYAIYRNIHQRLMDLVHLETKRSLDKQEEMNRQLSLAYITVQDSERKLEVTLNSIADAVIATDCNAKITLMNHVAEVLTGWRLEEAYGCAITEIFHTVNHEDRSPDTNPVMQTLLHGVAQGSSNTILVLNDDTEYHIAHSCAPMRDRDGQVIGAVLIFRDVTAENAARQALLDSNELVQTIQETMIDGIVTFNAQTHAIESVNAATEKMFGYKATELIGKKVSALVPELKDEQASLDYRKAPYEEYSKGVVREVFGQRKDGQHFPMEIAINEMRLGGQRYLACVLRNITARKHAEALMMESEYRYRNLFETIDEGFCIAEIIYVDNKPVDQLFLEINPSFEKQSGLHGAQGKYISHFIPNFPQDLMDIYDSVLKTGEPIRFEHEIKALHRWFNIYTCRFGKAGSRKVAILFTDITERIRAEQALRESDERMRLATEATGVGIWELDLGDNRMRWDAQMFRIYGLTPTPDNMVERDIWIQYLIPEDRTEHATWDKAAHIQKSGSHEFRIQRAGETDIHYIRSVRTTRTNGKGQVDSIVGTNLDITELKRTEQTLRESERHLRSVIDALPVAIYATDAQGQLTHFNQTAVEFSGRTPELGSDQWCREMKLFHPDGSAMPYHQSPMAIALSEGRQLSGIEAIAERPDGSRAYFVAYPTPLHDDANRTLGGINMLMDITERKRLDQVLLENNIELNKAKNLAEKANRAKSDFLSNMSHELRTPLNAILGFAQLIEASNPPPSTSQKRSVDQILQAGWYLLDLINEILDLTLIESGRLAVSMEMVSLKELMNECKTMMEPQALHRNITLNFPELECDFVVAADITRLKQVMINLLSNATKYNRPDGQVTVTCHQLASGRAQIWVEDTGEGLAPDKLAQLFQPFNRLGKENSAEEGTGIGLVMTKRLIKLMGGKITVESTPGSGTIFKVELAMGTAQHLDEAASPVDIAADDRSSAPEKTVRTILYVEDNIANLTLVEDIIAARPDLQLISATDGFGGLERARLAQPDVILMDINLPGMSGTEALKMLAQDPLTAHIPVIAVSANALPRDIEQGLAAGFLNYLTKPIKITEFMHTLDSALALAHPPLIKPQKETTT